MRVDIRRVRLGNVCEIKAGGTPSRSVSEYWESGTIPWVKIGDFSGKYLSKTTEFITQAGLEGSSAKLFPKGTILYSIFATLGAVSILGIDAATNQAIAGLRIVSEELDREYLYYYLLSIQTEVSKMGRGVAQNNINLGLLKNIVIPLPSLDEQKRIAAKLDLLCEIISKREGQLAKLKQLAKSRFVEMFGDAIWPKTTIGELSEFLTSGSRGWAKYYSDEGELFITIKNVKNTRISVDDVQYIVPPQGAEADRTRVKEGDLLISITADLGRTGVVTDEIASRGAYINQHLTRISLKRNVVDPLYAAFYIESPEGKGQIERRNQSAVKAGLNFESIRSIQLPLPPIGEQRKFAAFVAELDKSEFAIRKRLEKARLLYRAKLQEFFG